MAENLVKTISSIGQDNLIAGVMPPAECTGVTIRAVDADAVYVRGTIMAASGTDGKLVILGTTAEENDSLEAAYILSDDVEVGTSDVQTTAYRTGCFNTKAVTVKEGYTLTAADRENLRKYGIVFNDNMIV